MKRFKYTMLSFLPPVMALGLEFVASFFVIGVAILTLIATSSFSYDAFSDMLMDQNFNAILSMIFSLSCVVVFGIWYYWRFEGDYTPKPSRTFTPLMIISVVLMVPGAQFFSNILITITCLINPVWLENYMDLIESSGLADSTSILMSLYAVLLAPIGEELVFRGVTLHSARRAMPFWIANILQALLFGIFHMNVIQGVYAFALGLLLGYVCERGGSIYYSILLHMVFNIWGTYIVVDFGDNYAAYYAVSAVSIAVLVVSIIVFKKSRKKLALKNQMRDREADASYVF